MQVHVAFLDRLQSGSGSAIAGCSSVNGKVAAGFAPGSAHRIYILSSSIICCLLQQFQVSNAACFLMAIAFVVFVGSAFIVVPFAF